MLHENHYGRTYKEDTTEIARAGCVHSWSEMDKLAYYEDVHRIVSAVLKSLEEESAKSDRDFYPRRSDSGRTKKIDGRSYDAALESLVSILRTKLEGRLAMRRAYPY